MNSLKGKERKGGKEGERESEMGELVGERRRETEKERDIYRERRGSETDVPKL